MVEIPQMPWMEPGPVGVEHLVALLDVEELDVDLYRGPVPVNGVPFHMYGGQAAAQALRAAAMTVPEGRYPHSFHGYFLRRGASDRPIILHVDRDRDGRSFSSRRVVAVQQGEVIFNMVASFHIDEEGPQLSAVVSPTDVPDPDDLPDEPISRHNTLIEFKELIPDDVKATRDGWHIPARMWARTRGPVPDDRILHACLLTYLSDMGTGFGAVADPAIPGGGPSIDHAVWFHRPIKMDDWVLMDLWPVYGGAGRGFYNGAIYDRDLNIGVSIAQEGLLRTWGPGRPT
jgi:acyl-CoA thioesterase-2